MIGEGFNPIRYIPLNKRTRHQSTRDQQKELELSFQRDPKPCREAQVQLANQLNMKLRSLQIWFQNRRAKARVTGQSLPTRSFHWKPTITNSILSTTTNASEGIQSLNTRNHFDRILNVDELSNEFDEFSVDSDYPVFPPTTPSSALLSLSESTNPTLLRHNDLFHPHLTDHDDVITSHHHSDITNQFSVTNLITTKVTNPGKDKYLLDNLVFRTPHRQYYHYVPEPSLEFTSSYPLHDPPTRILDPFAKGYDPPPPSPLSSPVHLSPPPSPSPQLDPHSHRSPLPGHHRSITLPQLPTSSPSHQLNPNPNPHPY